MADIDPRILRVSIEIGGEVRTYGGDSYIAVQGQKFANPDQGECLISIANLDKEVRDAILTEASPFNQNPSQNTICLLYTSPSPRDS